MRIVDNNQAQDQLQRPYEAALRAVGAHLDDQHASHIQIIELVDGLMVQWGSGGPNGIRHVAQFSFDDLAAQAADLRKQRHRKRRQGTTPRIGTPSRYEDVLRALGYEMEKGEAYIMALDEVDDGFILTYQAYSPHEGYMLRKRLLVLGPDQQDMVLDLARRRRKRHKRTLFGLRAG